MNAKANADTDTAQAQSGGGAHGATGQDAHAVHDAQFDHGTVRSLDVDKDTGADERYEATGPDNWDVGFINKKRTTDQYQTLDTDRLVLARRDENIERERARLWDDRENQLRLRHMDAEFNQRMRHADFQVTALAAVTKEMIEAIADRTAEKVCARMGGGK